MSNNIEETKQEDLNFILSSNIDYNDQLKETNDIYVDGLCYENYDITCVNGIDIAGYDEILESIK